MGEELGLRHESAVASPGKEMEAAAPQNESQSGDCGNHLRVAARAKRKRDCADEVGVDEKRPRVSSISEEYNFLDSKLKIVKSEASLTSGDMGYPSGAPSADESLVAIKMQNIHEASLTTGDVGLPCGTPSAKESLMSSDKPSIAEASPTISDLGFSFGTPSADENPDAVKMQKSPEASLTIGDMGFPFGTPSADEKPDAIKILKSHDDVVDYLKESYGYGHYAEALNRILNETGDEGTHLRAVVRAKLLKRKIVNRGKALCASGSLAADGLTDIDVSNIRSYLNMHLVTVGESGWLRESKVKGGAYAAYFRAMLQIKEGTIYEILEMMKKRDAVPVKLISLVATETSPWEVKYLNIMNEEWEKAKKEGRRLNS